MKLTADDINLTKFLSAFTLVADANPGQKIVLANEDFLLIASLLKIEMILRNK